MLHKFVKGKVCVFIDATNILYSQHTLGWRLSYKRLMEYFKNECDLGKALVYTGQFTQDEKQKKFLDMLEINGYVLKTKEVKKIKVGKITANGKAIWMWSWLWTW